MPKNNSAKQWSIVAPDRFIRATRDSGYRNTASAISELVDNAIQAGAPNIDIFIEKTANNPPLEITIADNGCGMDPFTLGQAVRFGGSSRFNDRSSLGRFGMGLPNSSLSQARHVTVTSWRHLTTKSKAKRNVLGSGNYLQTYLDVDEIADGRMTEVPVPYKVARPDSARKSSSGTVVHWTQCDRLDYRRVDTLCKHLVRDLSQRFRFFLREGTRIRVNQSPIQPFDPLFLGGPAKHTAVQYGDDIQYKISSNPVDPDSATGTVRVKFTELPVAAWAPLSNDEKRRRRIVQNAGTSIIRANREVDYGWYFFGAKRKENYDDWWRCEIHFDPILDEAFGLTHTKQQVKPQRYLLDAICTDLESIARELSARARQAHALLTEKGPTKQSESIVNTRVSFLEPLPDVRRTRSGSDVRYRIDVAPLEPGLFFSFKRKGGEFVLTLDPDHAFFREFYALLSSTPGNARTQSVIELMLFSAARAEATMIKKDRDAVSLFRAKWGKTLETLLGD